MTEMPASLTAAVELRRRFDELIARTPIAPDVRTRESDLDGIPTLDVTIDGIAPRGTLLWVHGGAFLAGSARIALAPAAAIARTSGMRVLSIDYPLAPEHPHPAAVAATRIALRAALRDADGPVAIGGESAGGSIALGALVSERDAHGVQPVAALVLSPVTDLTVSSASYRTRSMADPVITAEIVELAASAYLGDRDRVEPTASPRWADLAGLPPLLVQVGGREVLLDDAVGLAARAAADGLDVILEVYADGTHVFPSHADTDPLAARAARRAGEFLRDAVSKIDG